MAGVLADSYVDAAARGANAVAKLAATRTAIKYANLPSKCIFQPNATGFLRPLDESAGNFLSDFTRKIAAV